MRMGIKILWWCDEGTWWCVDYQETHSGFVIMSNPYMAMNGVND
jgi:hypothetical protein